MKKKIFKFVAVVLAFVIVTAALPFSVFASDTYEDYQNGIAISYVPRSDNTAAIISLWVQFPEQLGDDLVIPEQINGYKVTEIRANSISVCCESVTIPLGITKIQNGAFMSATVNAIYVAEGHTEFKSIDGVLFSADGKNLLAYPNQRKTLIYTIPQGTEVINSRSFAYVSNTEAVIISDTVKKINSYAFYNSYIYDISIPKSVTSIGEGAFMSCNNLKSVYIPYTVEQIGDYVLDGTETIIFSPEGSLAQQVAEENGYSSYKFKEIVDFSVSSENNEINANQGGYPDSYWDENGNCYEWYHYNVPSYKLTFVFADETSETYTNSEFYETFGFWPSDFSEQSHENQWREGENHSFTICVLGMQDELEVYIKPKEKIKSFSIVPSQTQITEYTNGWYSYNSSPDELYWYYNVDFKYYVTTEKGEEYTFDYPHEIWDQIGEGPTWKSGNQSYGNQWSVGENLIEVELMGVTASAVIEIVEDDIVNVEAVMEYDLIENSDGYFETDYMNQVTYFMYTMNPSIKVTYKDNTSRTFNGIDEVRGEFNGEPMVVSDQSYENQWSVGTHTATLYAFGFAVPFDVNVVSGPVKSLTLLSDIKTEYAMYEEPSLDGVTLRVEFKDGTSVTKTFSIIDEYRDDGYYINSYPVNYSLYNVNEERFLRISYINEYIDIPIAVSQSEILSTRLSTPPSDIYWNNAVISVEYADGQTADYTVEEFYPYYQENSFDGSVKYIYLDGEAITDKGVFNLGFYGESDDMLAFSYAEFYAFGESFVLDDEDLALVNANYVSDTYILNAMNYDGYTSENIVFDGVVNENNIDLLVWSLSNGSGDITGEEALSVLSKNLVLSGDVDLTLSEYYDETEDVYRVNSWDLPDYYKDILEQRVLENGNYQFVFEYYFPYIGRYMYTAEVSAEQKLVSVSKGTQNGDVNGDGQFDIRDMIRLKKLLAENSDDVTYNTDVVRDGVLDSADTVAVKKYLLGLFV